MTTITTSKLASILIPTRGRFDSLLKAVDSIVKTTKDLSRIEIVLRFDDDDEESLSRLGELPTDKVHFNIMKGVRYKYVELHKYVNEMCAETTGEFIVWFNDDCVIQTNGWDDIVAKFSNKIVVLYPDHKGTGGGNIFPIINRKIYEIIGHFSLSPQVDTWQHIVGEYAGIHTVTKELVFIHNRKQDYISDTDRSEVTKQIRERWLNTEKDRKLDACKITDYIKANKL